jgi:hypothetical protein
LAMMTPHSQTNLLYHRYLAQSIEVNFTGRSSDRKDSIENG